MLRPCVAGPHTALAVIFNPVASTHQDVHLYLTVRVLRSLVVENYRTFPCGCAVNRTALESPRSDHHIPRPADGRLRLMAWPFRRSHTQWYPSAIDGWESVTAPWLAPRGRTAVPRDLDTKVRRLFRIGPISLTHGQPATPRHSGPGPSYVPKWAVSPSASWSIAADVRMTSLRSHQNVRKSIAATIHHKPGRYHAT